jgi:hypothetical protein
MRRCNMEPLQSDALHNPPLEYMKNRGSDIESIYLKTHECWFHVPSPVKDV